MEERRAEDKTHLADLEHRFNLVRDRVNEKFPQYDALTETYKAVNNKRNHSNSLNQHTQRIHKRNRLLI
jgi:hypothetical protein